MRCLFTQPEEQDFFFAADRGCGRGRAAEWVQAQQPHQFRTSSAMTLI
jgi:hypothetical protein